jgi:hypothetical protein
MPLAVPVMRTRRSLSPTYDPPIAAGPSRKRSGVVSLACECPARVSAVGLRPDLRSPLHKRSSATYRADLARRATLRPGWARVHIR